MFIKLIFTTGTNPQYTFKILDYLINQRPATGTNIKTYITAVNATLGALIDGTNSAVWNSGTGITALTSNTKSVFYKPTSSAWGYSWNIELSGYDRPNNDKHVVQFKDEGAYDPTSGYSQPSVYNFWNTASTSISTLTGEAIGTMNFGTSTVSGTGTLTLTNQSPTSLNAYSYTTEHMGTNLTGAVMYITDNCFMFSMNGSGVKRENGFPAGSHLDNTGYYRGVHFVGQYTRTDPWNTAANNVPPFVCSQHGSPNKSGMGFLASLNQVNAYQNVRGNNPGYAALVADRQLDNSYSSTNSTQPWVANKPVNFGCGNRFNDCWGLAEYSIEPYYNSTYSYRDGANVGAPLSRIAGTRYLSSDLKSTSYALLPLTWANAWYNNTGGNISDKTGVFWFNGDYFPGDILTSGTKTYILWPGAFSHTERIALAVPRE